MTPGTNPAGGPRALGVLVLFLVTLGLYARVGGFEFLNYDDPSYVSRNEAVLEGLSAEGLAYAFEGRHSTNWHPLTTLSHMLDAELFGDDPRGHHLVNAGLHALNAALCFLALLALLPGRSGTAFLVAALFALHPLRVESVAWVSERKDVLSGTFFFLTLWAHASYARRGGLGRYLLVAVCLALGLLAKQMLITVPFLLLLLDLWPLRRHPQVGARRLVLEKLPLLALVGVAVGFMLRAQSAGGTIGGLGALPVADRVAAAFGALFVYVQQSLVPVALSPFYPHPSIAHPDDALALWGPGAAGIALFVVVTVAGLVRLPRSPALLVGWSWYVGMLLPVIGLVQIGSQAHADRYTYLPAIGLYLAVVVLLADVVHEREAWRKPLRALAGVVLVAFTLLTWRQLGFWRDSETLYRHAIDVTERNFVAHNNLGLVYLEERVDPIRAEQEFFRALTYNPFFREAVFNLSIAYLGQGRAQDAEETLSRLLAMDPGHARAAARLGKLRASRGDTAGALENLRQATESDPANVDAWLQLGALYLAQGEGIFAEEAAARAIELAPREPDAHVLHARAAQELGYVAAAVNRLRTAVEVDPQHYPARVELANLLASVGELAAARAEVEQAVALDEYGVRAHLILSKIQLAEGEVEDAKARLELALELAPDDPEANEFLGSVRWGDGDREGAEQAYLKALEARPIYDPALYNLGALYQSQGREAEALARFSELLELNLEAPDAGPAARDRAWILATSPDPGLRDAGEAVRWAEFAFSVADEAQRRSHGLWITRAAAYAAAGRFEEAVQAQQVALQLAQSDAQRKQAERRLALFQAGQPFHRDR